MGGSRSTETIDGGGDPVRLIGQKALERDPKAFPWMGDGRKERVGEGEAMAKFGARGDRELQNKGGENVRTTT